MRNVGQKAPNWNQRVNSSLLALNGLDEYRRKVPNGLMTEERCVARVQALCALGRQREALAELDQLAPQSLAVAHAKESCDASSDAER